FHPKQELAVNCLDLEGREQRLAAAGNVCAEAKRSAKGCGGGLLLLAKEPMIGVGVMWLRLGVAVMDGGGEERSLCVAYCREGSAQDEIEHDLDALVGMERSADVGEARSCAAQHALALLGKDVGLTLKHGTDPLLQRDAEFARGRPSARKRFCCS